MRIRSPRIAPPLKGLLGSIASTPTSSPDPRTRPMSLSVSVDLPEPGAPVIPTVYAPPVLRYRRPTASLWSAGRMASMASRTPASRSSVSVSVSVGMCSPLGGSDPAPGPTPLFSHAFPGREEPHSSSGGGPDAPDVGAEGLELTGEIGIPAIDVVRIEDAGLAVGGEPGDHEGGAGAHVLSAHGCAGEPVHAPDHRVAPRGADVGAHAVELVDEPEPVVE